MTDRATDHLFVYGTLMRGHRNPMAELLASRAVFVGRAAFRGSLYRVKHYPGLVASDDEADIVHGDVFARCDDALIAKLDGYEGCGLDDPHPQQYRRVIVPVKFESGDMIEAWTYLYNWPIDGLVRIASGRFEAE